MWMKKKIAAGVFLLLIAFSVPVIDDHLQAVAVMLQVMNPETKSAIAHYRQLEFREESVSLPDGNSARRYIPAKSRTNHAMVVVHGVHRLGVEEPRLIAFSRALAAQGVEVLTPQLPGIADFRVTPDSIVAIGETAKELHRLTGKTVGIFGLSFSGGLALMTAADLRYQSDIAFVVAVGAHDDMGRVAKFFATDEEPRPNGSIQKIKAHEYGALVLMYAHPEDFFADRDLTAVRTCLHNVLYETTCDAGTLSPAANKIMQRVFAHDVAYFRKQILVSAEKHRDEYAQVSPRGKLMAVQAPVLLLHGAGDDVIPSAETEWLAEQIPAKYREQVLISPAISHVEIGEEPEVVDQFRVVHFLAEMIEEAEER
jgi:pimeloyl-ACP methyl ester carboxylesterase